MYFFSKACWRGYILRKRLTLALGYAKFDDLDDDLENFDEEVDLGDFDFNMVSYTVFVSRYHIGLSYLFSSSSCYNT